MKTMVTLIRNTAGVRCREVVRYGRFDCNYSTKLHCIIQYTKLIFPMYGKECEL